MHRKATREKYQKISKTLPGQTPQNYHKITRMFLINTRKLQEMYQKIHQEITINIGVYFKFLTVKIYQYFFDFNFQRIIF